MGPLDLDDQLGTPYAIRFRLGQQQDPRDHFSQDAAQTDDSVSTLLALFPGQELGHLEHHGPRMS